MTGSLAIYGIVVGSFFAGAAFFLDRTARALRLPTRWLWLAGMTGGSVAPFLPALFRNFQSEPGAAGRIPAELLYYLASPSNLPSQPSEPSIGFLGQPFLLLWVLASVAVLLVVFWTSSRLSRSSRGWATRIVGESEVLVSEGLGPAVFGLFRPRIVLPPWTLELEQEKLDLILLHEREHQRARDPATLALGLLLATLTPWNPAIWWMARRLHLAVEGDCDGRVLSRGISPTRYGNLLLEVASGPRGLPALAPALAEGGQTSLERRLLMIRSNVRKHGAVSATLAACLGGGLILLACETPTPPSQAEAGVLVRAPLEETVRPEAEDGYYLVKKDGDNVEVVRAVEAGELKLISEDGVSPPATYVVKEEGEVAGTISLRTTEEVEGPRPLYIVDGVILSDGTSLDEINKEDIASVNVIKGAAAELKYGERAKHGVVLITTKGHL